MPIVGYIILSWFIGMAVADIVPAHPKQGMPGDLVYDYASIENRDMIVTVGQSRGSFVCRPQCYMSGSFFNGVVRPMMPYPLRQGQYFDCKHEGDLDKCSGQVYKDGRWMDSAR